MIFESLFTSICTGVISRRIRESVVRFCRKYLKTPLQRTGSRGGGTTVYQQLRNLCFPQSATIPDGPEFTRIQGNYSVFNSTFRPLALTERKNEQRSGIRHCSSNCGRSSPRGHVKSQASDRSNQHYDLNIVDKGMRLLEGQRSDAGRII